jgi:hypothetical protein
LSAGLDAKGGVHILHEVDFIQNGKKFINPLDNPIKTLQLGGDNCYLDHLGMVYNRFSYVHHGLKRALRLAKLGLYSKDLPSKSKGVLAKFKTRI